MLRVEEKSRIRIILVGLGEYMWGFGGSEEQESVYSADKQLLTWKEREEAKRENSNMERKKHKQNEKNKSQLFLIKGKKIISISGNFRFQIQHLHIE